MEQMNGRFSGGSEFHWECPGLCRSLFFIVAIPLGSPGVISAIVLGFLEYWNLIEQPAVFLRTERLKPLSLYISTITKENAGVAFVAALVALLPPLLVFLCGHRYLEQGIAAMGGGSES